MRTFFLQKINVDFNAVQGKLGSLQETLEAWKDSNQWWKLVSSGASLKLLNGLLDLQDTLVDFPSWKQ